MKKLLAGILAASMITMLAACGGSTAETTAAAASGGGEAAASSVDAGSYPERTIEAVSQFGSGGGTDIYIRSIAVDAAKILGQQIIHVSSKGGGGMVAWDRFISQPADGYTLYAIGPEQIFMHIWGQIDMNEVVPIINNQLDTGFLYALKGSKFTNIDEVVEFAKANPKTLNIAYTNPASFDEVLLAMWQKEAGIEINGVPYGSGSDAIAALMGGHVDLLYEEVGPAVASIESGDFIPLVAFTDEPIEGYDLVKDVPTSVSKGWNVTVGRWRGFGVKKGTDQAIIDKLVDAFEQSSTMDTYKQVEKDNMLDIRDGLMKGEEYQKFIDEEIEKYKVIMDEAGIQPAQ